MLIIETNIISITVSVALINYDNEMWRYIIKIPQNKAKSTYVMKSTLYIIQNNNEDSNYQVNEYYFKKYN